MEWRLIESEPRPGAENMAVDQALLESVQAGGAPCLRLYRWNPPCLSLGRNQPAPPGAAEAAAARGGDVVRRPTGGWAVWHERELTYAVAVPVGVLGSPRESYRALHEAIAGGLRRLGVAAELAAGGRRSAAGGWGDPCFATAAPGEVVVDGRKLVGSAQRRERRTLLQHGSLLLDGGQALVGEMLGGTAATPRQATLAGTLGRVPAPAELAAALCAAFESVLGIRLARGRLTAAERVRVTALAAHFRSAAWYGRR